MRLRTRQPLLTYSVDRLGCLVALQNAQALQYRFKTA